VTFAELAEEPLGRLPVKVIRSSRRKKSSEARVVGNVIEVRIPAAMDAAVAQETVDELVERVERKRAIEQTAVDLAERARTLAVEYQLPEPDQIRWVTNQNTLWGSCSFQEGVIRISSRLTSVPDWVLDCVILHELTHLVEPGHGPEFHALMNRYPKVGRAEGFLEAMALGFAD